MDSKKDVDCSNFLNASTSYTSTLSNSTLKNSSFTFALTETQDKWKILMEGFNETHTENTVIINEISNLLKKLDLNPKTYSMEIKNLFHKMLVLKEECLTDFEDTIYQMCLMRRKLEEKKQEREEKRLKSLYEVIFKNYNKLHEKSCKLDEAVFLLEQDIQNDNNIIENESANQVILSNKLSEYEKNIEKMEKDLETMGVNQIHPEAILEKSKLSLEKMGELVELNNYLQYFDGLPPNLLQAKVVLENKKLEYEKVKQMLDEKI